MNKLFAALVILFVIGGCSKKAEVKTSQPSQAALSEGTEIRPQTEQDTLKGSLAAVATGTVGNTHVKITYHSPAVRERIIWGGLVPYDKVWVTGAHMATTVEFDQPVSLGGRTIAAGKYALFTIPGRETWTMILNKNWSQHLTDDYDEKEDIVRVKVNPELESSHQERLRYAVESEGTDSGEIVMNWEKIEVSLPFEVLR